MFARFVIPEKSAESHRLAGIFGAAYELRHRDGLRSDDRDALEDALSWFNAHLPIPGQRIRSRRGLAESRAIYWLKEERIQIFDALRNLAAMLERNGVATRVLRTARPGYVVYEDEYQVAAVPFRDTIA